MERWCGLPLPSTPPVVGLLHFMSKPFRLFYAYESATLSDRIPLPVSIEDSPPLLCFARKVPLSFSLSFLKKNG